jgi:hypothetical protein
MLRSVETTPNPNSMKLNLSAPLGGPTATYTRATRPETLPVVAKLLGITGVEAVFVCADFVTINRDPRADWEPILAAATSVLAGDAATPASSPRSESVAPLGQVRVTVQTFRNVPIQVKTSDGQSEKRVALDARFGKAAREIQARAGGDYLKERYWDDRGVRYGSVEEVAASVAEEIEALLDDDALAKVVAEATGASPPPAAAAPERLRAELASEDWRQRLRAVKQIGTDPLAIPLLSLALKDPKPEIRRWAAAGLGATASPGAVAPLCEALRDPSIAVRRTAGDSLSDLGDPSAQPAMVAALADPSKLVRWRAARFLAEVGTADALAALEKTARDPEFEVRREVEAAIERIRGGAPGSAPVWKRISG